MTKSEIETAIAFAHVEILELKAGRRTLTQCPGIEQLAKAAVEERRRIARDIHEDSEGTRQALGRYR